MQIDFVGFLGAILGGGGTAFALIKTIIKSEAKEALKEDLTNLTNECKSAEKDLHQRINRIEADFVDCRYCDNQHKNLDANFDKLDKKLDTILGKL